MLSAGEAQGLLSKDGEVIFILEHQLIPLPVPLLDPLEQLFHISSAAGATPSTIWAEAQTSIPARNAGEAEGEKRASLAQRC